MSGHCVVDWPLVETLAWIACAMVYSLDLKPHCVRQAASANRSSLKSMLLMFDQQLKR